MFERFDHDYSRDRFAFEEHRKAGEEFEAELDSPIDICVEQIEREAHCYARANATAGSCFAKIVASIARSALTLESISGMVADFVQDQLRLVRIKTTQAVLSLVKSQNPHMTIDIIEHVFGLSKESESDIARKHGVSRQIINKRAIKVRREFDQETERQKETARTYQVERLQQYENIRQKLQSIKNNARPATLSPA